MKAILEFNPSASEDEQYEYYCAVNGKKYRKIIEDFIRKMHLKHHEAEIPPNLKPVEARFMIENLVEEAGVEVTKL